MLPLKARSHKVKQLHCGGFQVPVLGPLLFLIFINDLPNSSELFTLLFADDTAFQISGHNLPSLFQKANAELNKANIWFQANKLTLNVSKTKFILFRKKSMHVDFSELELNKLSSGKDWLRTGW